LSRCRKFNPLNFFTSILHLSVAVNEENYSTALASAWRKTSHDQLQIPSKSSLSEFRQKVSYEFFESIFLNGLSRQDPYRRTYRGYYIYAADGDQYDLPASKDVLGKGYRGYPSKNNLETHFPKMYVVQLLDLVNGTVQDFRYSHEQHEVVMARELPYTLEKNSITIYDRAHCGYAMFKSHLENGNQFIVRARSNGISASRTMKKFIASGKKDAVVDWDPFPKLKDSKSISVRVVRVKNPRTKENLFLVTSLSQNTFSRKAIAELYSRRWEIETSFKELTVTLRLGKWHSQKLNGILQEIYALLWFINEVRLQVKSMINLPTSYLSRSYQKPNMKVCIRIVIENFAFIINQRFKEILKILQFWIRRTMEKRVRLSRSYPRVVKHRGREYAPANSIPRRSIP
jgi:hypothetical protein